MSPPPPRSTLFPYTTLFRSKSRRRRPILKLTPGNLRRNTTKHGAPDKSLRRRAATTKAANPSGGEAVREATALAHGHQTTHRTRSHRATERIERARLREGRSDAVKHSQIGRAHV